MKRVHFLQNMSLALFGVSTLGFANKIMKSKHPLIKSKNKKQFNCLWRNGRKTRPYVVGL